MTHKEIRSIILVSSREKTKRDFFEKKRLEHNCSPSEYYHALIDIFEIMSRELEQADTYHYTVIGADGQQLYESIPDSEERCNRSNLEYAKNLGRISNYKICLDLSPETFGEIDGNVMYLEEFLEIKPHLDAYCSWLRKEFPSDFVPFESLFQNTENEIPNAPILQFDENNNLKKKLGKSEAYIKEEAEVKTYIHDALQALDPNVGWKYAFTKEEDYKSLVNVLTDFFMGNKYTLPSDIRLKIDCKTKLAKVLRDIHKQNSKNKLKRDEDFYKILKILSPFKDQINSDIYNSLIK